MVDRNKKRTYAAFQQIATFVLWSFAPPLQVPDPILKCHLDKDLRLKQMFGEHARRDVRSDVDSSLRGIVKAVDQLMNARLARQKAVGSYEVDLSKASMDQGGSRTGSVPQQDASSGRLRPADRFHARA
ncbi:hypothetical protein [Agrobacterium tumefaciens]|uniref:hypothetical protein n=1 Tax=Agrobacterium tumefaciens TaxID=358 RepID=UPI00287C635B|nr:hypothetical protein [Agrobacterium tumefaciens]MDS7593898.1 hypothetical protein [Agrobacterium tumefaciens]